MANPVRACFNVVMYFSSTAFRIVLRRAVRVVRKVVKEARLSW